MGKNGKRCTLQHGSKGAGCADCTAWGIGSGPSSTPPLMHTFSSVSAWGTGSGPSSTPPSCTPFPLCLDPLLYQGHQEPGTEYQEVLYSQKPIRICGKKEAALLTYPGQRAAFAELLEAIAVALWGSLRM